MRPSAHERNTSTNAHTRAGMAGSSMMVTLLRQRTGTPIQLEGKDFEGKHNTEKKYNRNNRSNTTTMSTTCSTTTSRMVYFLRLMSTLRCFLSR